MVYPHQIGELEKIVLNEAIVKVAKLLDLKQIEVSQIVGLSAAEVSRLFAGKASISSNTKTWECAVLFIRAFRSLYTILGEDEAQCQEWFKHENYHLYGIPLELAKRSEGLVEIVSYLDAMRGSA